MNGSADNSPAPGERLEMTEERRSKLREIEVRGLLAGPCYLGFAGVSVRMQFHVGDR